MIKTLDQNELRAVQERCPVFGELTFEEKTIQVYLYEGLSLVFDFSELVWMHCSERGIIITSDKVAKALDALYCDAVRQVLKEVQGDINNFYENEVSCGEGSLDEELPDNIT